MRLLQETFDAIARLLDKDNDSTDREKDIEALYNTFGNDKDFFRNAQKDQIVSALTSSAADATGCEPDQVSQEELCQRTELLAALMYADMKISNLSDNLKKDIAKKALWLYQTAEQSSDTFSFERKNRINELSLIA